MSQEVAAVWPCHVIWGGLATLSCQARAVGILRGGPSASVQLSKMPRAERRPFFFPSGVFDFDFFDSVAALPWQRRAMADCTSLFLLANCSQPWRPRPFAGHLLDGAVGNPGAAKARARSLPVHGRPVDDLARTRALSARAVGRRTVDRGILSFA